MEDRHRRAIDGEGNRHPEGRLRTEVTDDGARIDLFRQRPGLFLGLRHDDPREREVLDVLERVRHDMVLESTQPCNQVVGEDLREREITPADVEQCHGVPRGCSAAKTVTAKPISRARSSMRAFISGPHSIEPATNVRSPLCSAWSSAHTGMPSKVEPHLVSSRSTTQGTSMFCWRSAFRNICPPLPVPQSTAEVNP